MRTRWTQDTYWLRVALATVLACVGAGESRSLCTQAAEAGRAVKPPSDAVLATSLVPNPGFEEPNLAGYVLQAKASANMDGNEPFQGRFSLCHDAVADHPWNCVQMAGDRTIPVERDKLYHLSVWSRNTLVGDGAKFGLRQIDAKGKSISYIWQSVPLGQDAWRRYDLTVRPVTEAVALQVYFYVLPGAEAGSVWWDAVTLSTVEDPFAGKTAPAAQIRLAPIDPTVIVLKDGRHEPDRLTVAVDVSSSVAGGR